ncbi:hypothetical protein OMP43_17825 [Sphingomonas sp. CBMAI 2297]|uniref:hypothetical protein n=1 Tax=Sphingomonas sp. CBMAI 2297 TaxID=2991720 RepID=UPI0024564EDF|nr:hypothetical protein [Sphingomonas sp. CBMAI 2297]MDH4745888.1 hypothetical protein [Sphingomonas sp. CBMAI 2297]
MKAVRAALGPLLERAQGMVPPQMQQQLRAELGPMGSAKVTLYLHQMRPAALELARVGPAREWKKLLDEHASEARHLVLYAATAWIARAVVMAEYLERADLANLPKKWAAEQTLRMVENVEGDEGWLWPFNSDSPWPEWEDEE